MYKCIYFYINIIYSWSANQIIGPANVYPNYGDIAEAWAAASTGTSFEFIIVL